MNGLRVNLGLAEMLDCVYVQEPAGGGEIEGMGDLAALDQIFDGNNADWLAEAPGGGLEGGETAPVAGLQFPLERRQY